MGSMISFVAVLYFMFIVWEAFISQRSVVLSSHLGTSLEWDNRLPADFHNLPETGSLVA